jgi:DHA1 family inner membrane transport protein
MSAHLTPGPGLPNRWALTSLMVAVFGVGTAEYVIAGILPTMAEELDVSVPQAGQLVTAYALAVVVGGRS